MATKNVKLKEGQNILYPQTKASLLINDDETPYTIPLASPDIVGGGKVEEVVENNSYNERILIQKDNKFILSGHSAKTTLKDTYSIQNLPYNVIGNNVERQRNFFIVYLSAKISTDVTVDTSIIIAKTSFNQCYTITSDENVNLIATLVLTLGNDNLTQQWCHTTVYNIDTKTTETFDATTIKIKYIYAI